MFITLPWKNIKSEKQTSNINIESNSQSKVKNIERIGSKMEIFQFLSMRVLFFKKKVAKSVSKIKLVMKKPNSTK